MKTSCVGRIRMQSMNEIERAVAEIVGSNYGECQCHRETMMLAAEALREQAERSKGCVWCKSDSQVTHNGEHFCFFCSYCGKRLEVEP